MISLRKTYPVTPAEAGVQCNRNWAIRHLCWTPAFAGVTVCLRGRKE
ncbi:MAG: hypothetical protein QG616_1920 [Pseudomonadota bacterium]|nr:hypothetical protein [Pseudomonadota bacterium]MDQ5882088.1 hypothetical protein [Pseudomonadota bacterium]